MSASPLVVALCAGVVLISIGCGLASGDSEIPSAASDAVLEQSAGVVACLKRVGAEAVVDRSHLEKVARDLGRGELDRSAGAIAGDIEVSEYLPRGSGDGGELLPYAAWVVAHLREQDLDPVSALAEGERDAIVLYLERPTWTDISRSVRCLARFGE